MAFASLSILGLYEWNTEIFDNLVVPEGIDRDLLIPEIVTQCSDFPLLYPNYDFMKMLIGVWSQKEQNIWTAMLASENFEYNPLENYDKYEEITRTSEGSTESSRTVSSSTDTDSSTSSTSHTEGSSTGTNTAAATAYNSITYQDTNKTTAEGSEERDTTASETIDATESTTGSDTGSSSSTGEESVVSHMHGNIGVTTAQQMIQGFREISDFCTYDFIVNSFKMRFCIQVY